MFALYGEWLGVALTDCEAWSTANQAFQRNYCAAHDGRTAEQHHAHMAQMFADFFEAAIDANVQALPAPAAPAAPAAAAPPMMCVIAEMPSVASYGMSFAASALVSPQRCTGRTTHVPSAENLSDWLTKPLKLAVFLPMRARMMHFARMPVASP